MESLRLILPLWHISFLYDVIERNKKISVAWSKFYATTGYKSFEWCESKQVDDPTSEKQNTRGCVDVRQSKLIECLCEICTWVDWRESDESVGIWKWGGGT